MSRPLLPLLLISAVAMSLMMCLTAAVVLAVMYGSVAGGPAAPSRLDGFSLEEVISGRFYGEVFNGTWISDDEFTYRSAWGGINNYNVATKTIKTVLPPEISLQLRVLTHRYSHDRNFILYSFDMKQTYRYSNLARYSIIDLEKNIVYPLEPQQLPRAANEPQEQLRYATWNKESNGLVYVYKNNIYYRSAPDSLVDTQITDDGQADAIFNGVPDWVYEEEVLSSDNAIWLSKNGGRMVFATFDDRAVDVFDYPIYGETGSMQFQYTTSTAIRYPKPGRKNPLVSLWSVDLQDLTAPKIQLAAPEALRNRDHYFTTVAWANDKEVFIAWLNRHQNVSHLSFCNVETSSCDTERILTEPHGWVDLYSPPKFSADGQQYLVVLPVDQGDELGNFKHVVLIDRANDRFQPLTQGRWEVTEIFGWDQTNQVAYVLGTAIDKPSVRHLYRVDTASTTAKDFACLTCGTSNADGKECTYNSIDFSSNLGHYLHGCDGPGVPRSVIKETKTGAEVYLGTDNVDLRGRMAQKAVPRPLNLQVPLKGGYNAQVRLLLPPSLNRNKASQYPLLVHVYGGPNSQQVSDRFRVDWGTHLASSRGVIYAMIDGRGTGYQGDKMLHEIYRQMGTVEIEDQIQVVQHLINTLPFVDTNRTAIWGWSYGGFAAASALAKSDTFKCAMSVAPVTNWIYYDSIYTERYMGLPTVDDNELGYVRSDLCGMADNFRNKQLYLVHGTADDNVHYQQSMMLSKALEAADVLFRQQSYPDENHNIGHLRRHLYHSLGAFLMTDCFKLENEVWG